MATDHADNNAHIISKRPFLHSLGHYLSFKVANRAAGTD